MICGLARVGADALHRAATTAPAPTRIPQSPSSPASISSAGAGKWGVVSRLEAGGGGEVVCAPPPQSACGGGAVCRSPAPTRVVGGAVPRGGGAVWYHMDRNW